MSHDVAVALMQYFGGKPFAHPIARLRPLIAVGLVLSVFGFTMAVSAGDPPLRPPFREVWEFDGGPYQLQDAIVAHGAVYLGTSTAYVALDLNTGKRKWEIASSNGFGGMSLTADEGTLYVKVDERELRAYHPRSGRARWSRPLQASSGPITVSGKSLYCVLRAGEVSAIDTGTGQPRWTCSLPSERPADPRSRDEVSRTPPVLLEGRLLVASRTGELFCLDPQSGALRWRRDLGDSCDGLVTSLVGTASGAYVTFSSGDLVSIDTKTGRERWRFATKTPIYRDPVLLGDLVIVACGDGTLRAFSTADGMQRWERVLSRDLHPDIGEPLAQDGHVVVVVDHTRLIALDSRGEPVWEWEVGGGHTHGRLIRLPDGLVLQEGTMRLMMGAPPKIPEGSAARIGLARKLVGRLPKLTTEETRMLKRLRDDAFRVLLDLTKRRLMRYGATQRRARGNDYDPTAIQAYSTFREAFDALSEVTEPTHTGTLIALLSLGGTGSEMESPRYDVMALLAREGDERVVPLFLKALRDPRSTSHRLAVSFLSRSAHPQAVRVMIRSLTDPRTGAEIRHEAFVNLARTGGHAGLRAVLTARDTCRTAPPLAQQMMLAKLGHVAPSGAAGSFGTSLLATAKDPSGIRWGWIASPLLGSRFDRWIARHDGKAWTGLTFVGRFEKPVPDWLPRFASEDGLRRDSDLDGWSDLIEDRIGTDPRSADSDGDGLKDSIDRNPLAAPRRLEETDRVLAAAFEGCSRFRDFGVPCYASLPKRVAPLELFGWEGTTVAAIESQRSSLRQHYGQGVGRVHFGPPSYDFDGNALRGNDKTEFVLWNEGRTEAKVSVSVYFGGLAGAGYDIHLKKIGPEWVVIEKRMIYIS